MRKRTFEQPVKYSIILFHFDNYSNAISEQFHSLFVVFHADGALKLAPACSKFKLLKAECLALLGRVEVSCFYCIFFSNRLTCSMLFFSINLIHYFKLKMHKTQFHLTDLYFTMM